MRRKKIIIGLAVAVVLLLGVAGAVYAATGGQAEGYRGGGPAAASGTVTQGQAHGGWGAATSTTVSADAAVVPLTDAEQAAILFLREEEKLARDVYKALSAEWDARVFANIATSESRHMASVETLIDNYGLTDPVAVDTAGAFTNPELQTLYTQLVAQGSQSLEEAYKVGLAIETLDIEDLEALLAQSPAQADVTQVAQNLLRGSENHLASFTRLAE